jgi:tRNA threonylcarbamoyladenosine biosynthesis protein TsaE
MATIIFETPEAMQTWGKRLARFLETGDVIAMIGDLGSGKTTLTQGIAAGWGSPQRANSPTFALVNEYRSRRGTLQHMDLYRLSPGELNTFPLEDYLDDKTTTVIEWADRAQLRWPKNILKIQFRIPSPSTRQIEVIFPASWKKSKRSAVLMGQHG